MTDTTSFVPSGFFVIRSPLLPYDELLAWAEGLEAPAALGDPVALEPALAADRVRLRERLRAAVARPEVREAIFVASPDLDANFDRWLADPDSDRGRRAELALVRYFERMASRPTPFGLFAGCAVGTISERTCLTLGPRADYRRNTRLDMHFQYALAAALTREPGLRDSLSYYLNSSLYYAAGSLRYLKTRPPARGLTHARVVVEPSKALDATLARAQQSSSRAALAVAAADGEMSAGEAEAYVDQLAESELLVPDVTPVLTGSEPVYGLLAELHRHPAASDAAVRLAQSVSALEAIDAAGLGAEPARYRAIASSLAELPAPIELAKLFQADLIKPADGATLGGEVLAEIARGLELLQRIGRGGRDRLSRFREAFVLRYEGREVPLAEALDEEIGIGFGRPGEAEAAAAPLLEGLAFPRDEDERGTPWGPRHALLMRKLSEALSAGAQEMVLADSDLEQMSSREPPPLPDAFAVIAVLAAASDERLVRGEFSLLLSGAAGPSGARMLGRFCHADERLHRLVEQHLRDEQALQPDAIFAEIVHLPEPRTGNIVCRPLLREYEIPYLGRSGAPPERQIPVSDFWVSVVGERIRLRSARLGREVIPRLTSAQNFFHLRADRTYQFLGALQSQGVAGALGWDWGALADAPFLPRVRSGRLVLAQARWRARRDELRPMVEARGAAAFQAVEAWRERRRLPRRVALAEYDNELPVDFDNVLSVESFVQLVRSRDEITLVEPFPGPDELCLHGPEGRFVHELVVPFVRGSAARSQESGVGSQEPGIQRRGEDRLTHPRALFEPPHTLKSAARRLPTPDSRLPTPVRRTFPPGSEWLYAKLYVGYDTADRVLRDTLGPLVEQILGSGAADSWFFIRYSDPEWHLRLRFHGEPERLHREVLPALEAAARPLLADGRVWKLQLDTYEREVERYGGPDGIALAERLFQADSEAALAILASLLDDETERARWRLTLRGMGLLLADLGFDLETSRSVARAAREAYGQEFRVDLNLQRQLGERYRAERQQLDGLLDPLAEPTDLPRAALAALARRSECLARVAADLQAAEREGRLTMSLAQLAPSYLHMHAFRLLRGAHRQQELVLYELLSRLYDAQTARAASRPRQP